VANSDTFRYLATDFAAQKAAFIQRVRARYPGVWNDFSQGSLGVLLIDIGSWALETTAYTVNRLAAENFVPTMQLRESMVRWSAPYGYNLRGAQPATVPCTAILPTPAVAEITLTAGTPVRTSPAQGTPLAFELAQDYTIAEGELTPLAVTATFNPALAGTRNISALISVVDGSVEADCLDQATDLRQLVQVGQLFRAEADTPEYEIISIEAAPGASSYNRLVLGTPWVGTTAPITAEVIDRRVIFVQGQTQLEQLTAPTQPSAFTVRLVFSDVIDGSVRVAVNGTGWNEVGNLGLAAPTDEAFAVRTLATGETIVQFGDGVFGAVLPAQASLAFTYRTGGGASGNIPSGLIATTVTGQIASLSSPVTVAIANAQPGSGGQAPETLEEARVRVPAYIQTNDRAVTLQDYQTLATQFNSGSGQVRFARATRRTQNALLEGNVVVIYAWTTGPDNALVPLSTGFKAALQAYLQQRAVGTDYVLLADGDATSFPLACRFQATPGYEVGLVEEAVLAATSAFVTALAPGAPALYSQLVTQLAAVPGVLAVTVATPAEDVRPPSDKTVFAPPTARPFYPVAATSQGGGAYTAQAPAVPLVAWGLAARLNGDTLNITPDTTPGFARLTGPALDAEQVSRINLQTGLVEFFTAGPVGTFELGFISVQGFSRERPVDLYASYDGDNSLAKRREVRAALRAWAAGLPVGAPLFADEVTGAESVVSARAVIAEVSGVRDVTRVAFDAPANPTSRLDVSEFELASLRNVFINNAID
jgi:hypothetical protein